jgi:hypothetical protein
MGSGTTVHGVLQYFLKMSTGYVIYDIIIVASQEITTKKRPDMADVLLAESSALDGRMVDGPTFDNPLSSSVQSANQPWIQPSWILVSTVRLPA